MADGATEDEVAAGARGARTRRAAASSPWSATSCALPSPRCGASPRSCADADRRTIAGAHAGDRAQRPPGRVAARRPAPRHRHHHGAARGRAGADRPRGDRPGHLGRARGRTTTSSSPGDAEVGRDAAAGCGRHDARAGARQRPPLRQAARFGSTPAPPTAGRCSPCRARAPSCSPTTCTWPSSSSTGARRPSPRRPASVSGCPSPVPWPASTTASCTIEPHAGRRPRRVHRPPGGAVSEPTAGRDDGAAGADRR